MATADIIYHGVIGTTNTKTSGTTLTFSPSSAVPAGRLLVLYVLADNASATTPTITGSDNSSQSGAANSYTTAIRNSGQASGAAGLCGAIVYSFTTRQILTTDTITVTFGTSISAKAVRAEHFSYVSAIRGSAVLNSATTGTAGTTGNITGPLAGDLVLGLVGHEDNDTLAADGDTTNGSWNTSGTKTFGTSGGSGATNVQGIGQHKVVTADGTQVYNSTVVSGDWIAVGLVFQPADAVAPNEPTSVEGVPGPTQVLLSWDPVTDNGGKAVTGYAIDYSSNGGSSWSTFTANTGSTLLTATVTGLTDGTEYIFRVAAINPAGTGAWSASTNTITPGPYPQLRAAASATNTGASGTTLDVSRPAGTVDGDFLLAHVRARGLNADTELSLSGSGWTKLDWISVDNALHVVWWKFASSEPASYTFTQTDLGGRMSAAVAAFTGVHETEPINASAGTADAAEPGTLVVPGVTTTATHCMIVRLWGWRGVQASDAGVGFNSPPAGVVLQWSQQYGSSGDDRNRILAGIHGQAAAGATGDSTASGSASGVENRRNGFTIALRPAAAGGGPEQTVVGLHIAGTATTYEPAATFQVHCDRIATTVLYQQAVSLQVENGTIAGTATVHAPGVGSQVDGAYIASTAVLGLHDAIGISPAPFVAGSSTAHAPSVSSDSSLPFLPPTGAVHTPSLAQQVVGAFIAGSSTVHAPTVTGEVVGVFIAGTSVAFTGAVTSNTEAPFIAATTAVHTPQLTGLTEAPFIAGTATAQEHAVTPGSVTIGGPTVAPGSTLYSLLVSASGSVPFLLSGSVNAPALSTVVDVGPLAGTATAFEPAVQFEVATAAIGSTAQVHAHEIAVGEVAVELAAWSASATLYETAISPGPVVIEPAAVPTATVHEPAITIGVAYVVTVFLAPSGAAAMPAVAAVVDTPTIAASSAVHAPALSAVVETDAWAPSSVVHAPAAAAVVAPGALTGGTVHTPAVSAGAVGVETLHVAGSSQAYTPEVSVGAVTVETLHIAGTAQAHATTVVYGGYALFLPGTGVTYSHEVSAGPVTVETLHIAPASAVNNHGVVIGSAVIPAPFLEPTGTVHNHAVGVGSVAVAPQELTGAAVVHAPAVAIDAVSVELPLLAAGSIVHTPTVVADRLVVVPAISPTTAVGTHAVTVGATSISVPFLAGQQPHEQIVAAGPVAVEPAALASTTTLHTPAISAGAVTVEGVAISSTAVVRPPDVASVTGTVVVIPISPSTSLPGPGLRFPIDQLNLLSALRAWIEQQTGRPCYIARVGPNSSSPYVVLQTLPAHRYTRTLRHAEPLLRVTVQIDAIGRAAVDATWMLDQAAAAAREFQFDPAVATTTWAASGPAEVPTDLGAVFHVLAQQWAIDCSKETP